MREDVISLLTAFGVTGADADPLIDFILDSVIERIKNETNLNSIPEGLKKLAVEMAVGQYLSLKKSLTDDPHAPGYCYRAHGLDVEGDCDAIYIGAYLGINIGFKLYSLSGKAPTTDITLTNARTFAQARGTGYQLVSFYPLTLIQCLYLIMYKNRNGQAALGKGYTSASVKINTGGTNAKGMCYGETGGKQQMCFLGIEDFWGTCFGGLTGFIAIPPGTSKRPSRISKTMVPPIPSLRPAACPLTLAAGWVTFREPMKAGSPLRLPPDRQRPIGRIMPIFLPVVAPLSVVIGVMGIMRGLSGSL